MKSLDIWLYHQLIHKANNKTVESLFLERPRETEIGSRKRESIYLSGAKVTTLGWIYSYLSGDSEIEGSRNWYSILYWCCRAVCLPTVIRWSVWWNIKYTLTSSFRVTSVERPSEDSWLTLKMTSACVVETSVTNAEDRNGRTTRSDAPEFKPFTLFPQKLFS